ncbi:FAD-dependent oxidoreductase [Nonomuraea sp. NPDC052116]|uniref:FAD-dependent oxidoreductase n=1 Tax=Nonomuraea sp. NPDC052116 TaxID=3155665 RepID=UPI00342C8217
MGSGILGVSTAAHLGRGGAEVVLVTEAEPAGGASGRSLSWLNSAGARSGPYHLRRLLGIDRYRTRFAADPVLEWLRFDGGLWWTTPDGAERTRARHEHETAATSPTSWTGRMSASGWPGCGRARAAGSRSTTRARAGSPCRT